LWRLVYLFLHMRLCILYLSFLGYFSPYHGYVVGRKIFFLFFNYCASKVSN
jgi:hypothetical protein